MENTQRNPITVTTLVNAPVSKVWTCWIEPSHITRWCSASEDWHAPHAENDVRKDGKFKTRMEAKDGSFGFDFEGVYTNVEPQRRIEYSMPDGRKVSVTFAQEGDATRVTETFDPESENPEEMQRGGWQAILDNFRRHAESA